MIAITTSLSGRIQWIPPLYFAQIWRAPQGGKRIRKISGFVARKRATYGTSYTTVLLGYSYANEHLRSRISLSYRCASERRYKMALFFVTLKPIFEI